MLPWTHPNDSWISSAVFPQLTAEGPYTLQWAAPFSLKIASSHWEIWTPSNIWFLGPTQVTDRQTDHSTPSVTTGSIYVRCT